MVPGFNTKVGDVLPTGYGSITERTSISTAFVSGAECTENIRFFIWLKIAVKVFLTV
jgi:hypothetical protein